MEQVFELGDLFSTPHFTEQEVVDIYNSAARYQGKHSPIMEGVGHLEEILGREVDENLLPELEIDIHATHSAGYEAKWALNSLILDSKRLLKAKEASFPLSGSQQEMIKSYLIGELAWERYETFFENHGDRHTVLYVYFHLIEKKHGKLKRDELKRIILGMTAEDFAVGRLNPLKEEYFRLAYPNWISALFEGTIWDYEKEVRDSRLTNLTNRIIEDFDKMEETKAYFPRIARFSQTEPTKRLMTLEMEYVVQDICFTHRDELAVVSSDYDQGCYILNLFSFDGKKKSEYVLKSAYPGNFSNRHVELNRWKNMLSLVIDGQNYPFDAELNILEPEPEKQYGLMRTDLPINLDELREILRRNMLISLSTFDIGDKEVSFGVYLGGDYGSGGSTLVMREDGKFHSLRFNGNGIYPVKSETPAIAAFPDGSVLVYSGDFYKIDPTFSQVEPFAFPFTSNTESGAGDSLCTNSHFATDALGRLYIINQYKEFKETDRKDPFLQIIGGYDQEKARVRSSKKFTLDYTLELADSEPTPSMKLMRLSENKPRHLTAIPMSGVGNTDYFGSVAVARDFRVALADWDKIHIYEPIKEKAFFEESQATEQLPPSV